MTVRVSVSINAVRTVLARHHILRARLKRFLNEGYVISSSPDFFENNNKRRVALTRVRYLVGPAWRIFTEAAGILNAPPFQPLKEKKKNKKLEGNAKKLAHSMKLLKDARIQVIDSSPYYEGTIVAIDDAIAAVAREVEVDKRCNESIDFALLALEKIAPSITEPTRGDPDWATKYVAERLYSLLHLFMESDSHGQELITDLLMLIDPSIDEEVRNDLRDRLLGSVKKTYWNRAKAKIEREEKLREHSAVVYTRQKQMMLEPPAGRRIMSACDEDAAQTMVGEKV